MNDPKSGQCPRCIQLEELVRTLTERVEALEAELARSKKDSSNSSKPPSNDIVKPPKAASQAEGKRKQGAQRGHTRHKRSLFTPEEIDTVWEYRLGLCPDCGGCVEPSTEPPRILQQVEITPRPIELSEHRGMACYCPHCHQTHFAPIDEPVVRAGLIGPRLSALVALPFTSAVIPLSYEVCAYGSPRQWAIIGCPRHGPCLSSTPRRINS
jgi:transposase